MKHFCPLKTIIFSVFLLISFSRVEAQARYLFSPAKELGVTEVDQPKNLSIPLEVSYYNDGTATMRCNQIPSSYFHPVERSFSPGFYKGVLWVELTFKDTRAEDGEWQFYGRTGRSLKRNCMNVPSWRLVIPLNEAVMSDGPMHKVRIRMCAYLGAPVSFSLQPFKNYSHANMVLSTFTFSILISC